jgi:type I restriction enzyme M protein
MRISKVKVDNKNQKTVLSNDEEKQIIDVFNDKETVEDFSIMVSADELKNKKYSFSAGQYFDVKIEYVPITQAQFTKKIAEFTVHLDTMFSDGKKLEKEIKKQVEGLVFEGKR